MRVGILTWYYAANYGAKAHSLGLQKKVIELGHECELIDYKPKGMKVLNYKMSMGREYSGGNILNSIRGFQRCRKFIRGNSRYITSKTVHSAKEIDQLGYDLIILGSDEVFNLEHPLFDPIYYGVGLKTVCMTYAPSSGQCNEDMDITDEMKKSLMRMVSISARDMHTKSLIQHNVKKNVDLVVDPTFLYDYKEYEHSLPVDKYILVYSFSEWKNYGAKVREYAKEYDLKIVSIGRKICWADKSYDIIGLEEWLGAFASAELVITDSFHGTVFALKNKKEFVIMGREDKLNKINDLMELFELNRKFYFGKESIDSYLSEKLDYSAIEEKIKELSDESVQYLKEAFCKVMIAERR